MLTAMLVLLAYACGVRRPRGSISTWRRAPNAEGERMASKRPQIVVVNSDLSFLQMIAELLGEEGYDTAIIQEDSGAFTQIKELQPALVMIELMLSDPERGLMVLNKMRLDPQTAAIPVIIASTATDLIDRNEQHLRAKRCDILLKPFDLEELLTIIGRHVPLRV
jgi:CheY-like chemotaxis protein